MKARPTDDMAPSSGADYAALVDFARVLNHQLQASKITEAERAFLISGVLIGLRSEAFRDSLARQAAAGDVARALAGAIASEFERAGLPDGNRGHLSQAFSFIPVSPALTHDSQFLPSLIRGIDSNLRAFLQAHPGFDAIGHFYVEFLRYANNDKGLGIVLTPHHVAELFAALAGVGRDSIVFDNCCGTGGLLVAASKAMLDDAASARGRRRKPCTGRLLGIEFQPKVHALAVSSMVLHGHGGSFVHHGDCFRDADHLLRGIRPTVGLLNPPYKNKAVHDDHEELEFVLHDLACLAPDATCVAIVPITWATAPSGTIGGWKRALLERHTLEAVMSMPAELFHNSKTTVVTCIMVFTAHRPHPKGKQTWFGYWRDDGFVKTKHRGRIDARGTWPAVRDAWVRAFRSRAVVDGLSVVQEVGPVTSGVQRHVWRPTTTRSTPSR